VSAPRTVRLMSAAVAVGAALVLGTASGLAVGLAPRIQAPHACTVMANAAEQIARAQRNEVTSTQLRATRGQSEYAEHDADIARLWDEIDEAGVAYDEAKAECLGGAR